MNELDCVQLTVPAPATDSKMVNGFVAVSVLPEMVPEIVPASDTVAPGVGGSAGNTSVPETALPVCESTHIAVPPCPHVPVTFTLDVEDTTVLVTVVAAPTSPVAPGADAWYDAVYEFVGSLLDNPSVTVMSVVDVFSGTL